MTTNAAKAAATAPRRFYPAMSLLTLAVVTYGFRHTVGAAAPCLYAHAS
jgi:hypothetical protein